MGTKVKSVGSFELVLASVLDSEAGCFTADASKEEWQDKASTILSKQFGVTWVDVPTFDPASKSGAAKPADQQQVNRIRLAVQASRKARLIAKYGEENGKPKFGNVDAYWSELRAYARKKLAAPKVGTTETEGTKADSRNERRTKDQVFRDQLAAWIAECTRTSVKQSDQTLAQRNGMQTARDLMKLIGDHIPASPKK